MARCAVSNWRFRVSGSGIKVRAPEAGNQGQETGNLLRGQSTVEFILILVVAFLLLSVVFIVAGRELAEIQQAKYSQDARIAVSTIASAAKEVYAQGEGARKLVYVKLPPEYDPLSSYVANNTIYLSVRQSGYAETFEFAVHGNVPLYPGGNYVWVISEGSGVSIGSAYLYVSRSAIPVSMQRNSTISDTFYVKNVGNDTINVSISPSWGSPDVSLNISDTNFSLASGANSTITLTFSSGSLAYGLYGGTLLITALTPLGTETYNVLVSADVASPGGGGGGNGTIQNLTITPHLWNISVSPGIPIYHVFNVCSGPNSSFGSVVFVASPGPPGTWIGNLSSIGPLQPDSCLLKQLYVTVPNATASGTYAGYITIIGDSMASDSVTLIVNVTSADVTPPDLWVGHSPRPAYTHNVISIFVIANDSSSGGSNISNCIVSIDSGAFNPMTPADGMYNSPYEAGRYDVQPNTLLPGRHNATVRCNDSMGNTAELNYSFNVFKEILFLTNGSTLTADETNLKNFLDHRAPYQSAVSQMGFSWAYDIAPMANITLAPGSPGYVDLYYYKSILMIHYRSGIGLGPKISGYRLGWRSVGILGDGISGAQELGYSTLAPVSITNKRMWVVNNTHNITSGFPLGSRNVLTHNFLIWYFPQNAFHERVLGDAENGSTWLVNNTMLGQSSINNVVFWGIRFDSNDKKLTSGANGGIQMLVQMIDYVLSTSVVVDV